MPAHREHASRLLSALGAGALAAAGALLLNLLGLLEPIELRMLDVRARWTLPEEGGHKDVLIVHVSDESLEWALEKSGLSWPWPWAAWAYVFRACTRGQAKAVVFDFFLDDPREGLPEFLEALKKAPPSFLAVQFVKGKWERDSKRPDQQAVLERYAIAVDNDGSVEIPPEFVHVKLPHATACPAFTGGCFTSTRRDEGDSLIRRYRLFTVFEGKHYPSFALAALMAREGERTVRVRDRKVLVGSVQVPVERDGTITLRYYRPHSTFAIRAASRVIGGLDDLEESGKVTTFDPADFRGKVVIVGSNAAALGDLKVTPVAKELPGCEIHATALANLMNGDMLREAPAWVSMLSVAVMALIVAAGVRTASALGGAAMTVAFFAGAVAANTAVYRAGWVVDLVPQLAAVVLAYGAASALNYLIEGRQRQRVKREFQRYLSPKVVEKILRNPDALSMEGERKMLTIFFMDFAGFTSLSETVEPMELVRLVSEYHNEAAQEIFRTEGTLDKFIGDAIMAFWNDPIEQPDHALRACRSAVAAQKQLREQAVRMRARGLPEMRARIGLNTGFATVGNMGAKGQVNYTLIGDEVNLASRLEGVNKEFGTEIIVSEATYLPAREHLEVRELALIKVKGKKQAVRIYELLGLKGEVEPARVEAARRFEAAVADFRARRFAEAEAAFAAMAGDKAGKIYLGLCREFAAAPPPAEWDGSYQMEHK